MSAGSILVTGGSSGIGAELAQAIAATGRRVGIVSRRGHFIASNCRPSSPVDWLQADLTRAEETKTAIRRWMASLTEPLDGIVLSATLYGHSARHPVLHTSLEEWDEVMATNLRAQFIVVSTVLPALKDRPQAMILSISSLAAIVPAPGRAPYAASKAGARAFFQALSDELSGTGVSVVQVMPRNQVATPGLEARRPPGFSFQGYDAPDALNKFVLQVLSSLGKEFDGDTLVVGADGSWVSATTWRERVGPRA